MSEGPVGLRRRVFYFYEHDGLIPILIHDDIFVPGLVSVDGPQATTSIFRLEFGTPVLDEPLDPVAL